MSRVGRFRRAIAIAALVVGGVSTAPATSAADEHPLSVFREIREQIALSNDQPLAFKTLTCPKGFILLTPFWENNSEGFVSVAIGPGTAPSGSEGVTFAVDNRSGGSFTMVVGIKCLAKQTGAAKDERGVSHTHPVETKVVSRTAVIPARGGMETAVPCGEGFTAIGGTFSGEATTPREVSAPSPDGDSWRFFIDNFRNEDVTATVQARCLRDQTGDAKQRRGKGCGKGKRRGRRRCRKGKQHRHRVDNKVVEAVAAVPSSPRPQQDAVKVSGSVSCGDGFFASLLGFDFRGHPFTYVNSFLPNPATTTPPRVARAARVGGGVFQIANQSTELTARFDVVCIRERTVKTA